MLCYVSVGGPGGFVQRGRGGPPGGFPPRGGAYRGRGGRQGPREGPIKFENDYDFETANAQFEEIEKEFKKVSISGMSLEWGEVIADVECLLCTQLIKRNSLFYCIQYNIYLCVVLGISC